MSTPNTHIEIDAKRKRSRPRYFHEDTLNKSKKKYKYDTDDEDGESISIASSSSEENEFDEDEKDDVVNTEHHEKQREKEEDDDESFLSAHDDYLEITTGKLSVRNLSNSVTQEELERKNQGVGMVAYHREVAHDVTLDENSKDDGSNQTVSLEDIDKKVVQIKNEINNNTLIINNNIQMLHQNIETAIINNYSTTTINNNYSNNEPESVRNNEPDTQSSLASPANVRDTYETAATSSLTEQAMPRKVKSSTDTTPPTLLSNEDRAIQDDDLLRMQKWNDDNVAGISSWLEKYEKSRNEGLYLPWVKQQACHLSRNQDGGHINIVKKRLIDALLIK